MPTLTEYRYLGNERETRMGIAKTAVLTSPWLKYLPFIELKSSDISRYKMEISDGGASVHSANDTWSTANPTWEYREAALAILGDNVDVDEFGQVAAGPEDVWAAALELKSKGVGQQFEKLAIYGRTTSVASLSSSNNFKGLLLLIAEAESSTTTDLDGWLYSGDDSAANNKQVLFAASGASAALSIAMLRALRDSVKPKATHLIMSSMMRQKLESLAEASGTNLEHDKNQLGEVVTRFGEQIVLTDDQIRNNMDDSSALVTSFASYNYAQVIASTDDTSVAAI